MEDGENQVSSENGNGQPRGETSTKLPEGIIGKVPGRRGRPPGSRNASTPIDTGSAPKSRSISNAGVDAEESAKFLGTGFVALIEVMESFVHSSCANKIEKRMPGKLAEFKEMAQGIALRDKEKETMQACVAKISAKHEFLTKFGPEVVLGVMLSQYSLRQIQLMRFVENVTKSKIPEPIAVQKSEINQAV